MVHYELLPTGQTITGDLYLQQLERVQQALHQKEPSLVNGKGVLFLHDKANRMSSELSGIPYSNVGGRLCAIHRIHLTLRQPITTYSTPWIIIFVENPSPMKQTWVKPLRTSLLPKPRSSTARRLNSWRHVGRRCWIPMAITLKTNYKLYTLLKVFLFFT